MKTQYRKNTKTNYDHRTFKEWCNYTISGGFLSGLFKFYIIPALVIGIPLSYADHEEDLWPYVFIGFIIFVIAAIIATWFKKGIGKAFYTTLVIILVIAIAIDKIRYDIYVDRLPEPQKSEMTLTQKVSGFYHTNSFHIRRKARKLEKKDFKESIKGLDRAQRVEKSIIHSIDKALLPPSREYIQKAADLETSKEGLKLFKKNKDDTTDNQ